MMNDMLKAASWYRQKGFSVIPIKPGDKKPLIRWEAYQKKRATDAEVRDWFTRWPNANIGLVTGAISGVDVVDVDSDAGKEALAEFMPDTLVMPTCTTPSGGCHHYFAHRPGLVNKARVITDCDVRTCGGYVVAPPSKNGKGSYTWMPGLKINEIDPPAMPDFLHDILSQGAPHGAPPCNITLTSSSIGGNGSDFQRLPLTSGDFHEGERDQALFHLANCLFKGGMPEDNIIKYLLFFAKNCAPPFPEKEVFLKFESAKKRNESGEINIAQEVRDFVVTSSGFFLTSDVFQRLPVTSNRRERKAVVLELLKLCKKGEIERHPTKNGCYRKIEGDCDAVDFLSASPDPVKLWLPCDLNQKVQILPGNIAVIAGSSNSGKTAFILNTIRRNMPTWETHLFNSEMGPGELRKRLMAFDDILLKDWHFKAWERSSNFADVIRSGEGKLNIIDFLEISENFYQVSGMLTEIHKRLKGAVAIVALQKNKGADLGLGGARSLEKPRLYLSMDSGVLKIQKAKNWASAENPNGLQYTFKLVGGHKFVKVRDWHRPDPS